MSGNIVGVLVAASIGAAIAPAQMQMMVSQQQSRAHMEAKILYQAEVDYMRREWSIGTDMASLEAVNTGFCTHDTSQSQYISEGYEYVGSCTVGRMTVGNKAVLLSYSPDTNNEYTNPDRSFGFETPTTYSHVECLPDDPWGVQWYNKHLKAGFLDACIPSPLWSKDRYLSSNPDNWLYDISGFGFGQHPDY
jgi:hypothetical protein